MSESQLKKDVLNELEWEPSIDNAEAIGVAVQDGVVTLSGVVTSYAEKLAAERAAKRVRGVKGVAEDIVVKLATSFERTDADIAKAAIAALAWNVEVPNEKIQVKVEDGLLTLDGEVVWAYQREAAGRAVRGLVGVRGLVNLIRIRPRVESAVLRQRIVDAFKRNAELDAKKIRVESRDGRIALYGQVGSWREHDEATYVVWSAPGVTAVEDHITVGP
jgi:osmotically-inducible protein OsmY